MTFEQQIQFAKVIKNLGLKSFDDFEKMIIDQYVAGKSASMLQKDLEQMGYKISVRQIQRWLKNFGVIRTVRDSFRLAVKQGRVTYHRKSINKLGYDDKSKTIDKPKTTEFIF